VGEFAVKGLRRLLAAYNVLGAVSQRSCYSAVSILAPIAKLVEFKKLARQRKTPRVTMAALPIDSHFYKSVSRHVDWIPYSKYKKLRPLCVVVLSAGSGVHGWFTEQADVSCRTPKLRRQTISTWCHRTSAIAFA
jgi:hypothetical protein